MEIAFSTAIEKHCENGSSLGNPEVSSIDFTLAGVLQVLFTSGGVDTDD